MIILCIKDYFMDNKRIIDYVASFQRAYDENVLHLRANIDQPEYMIKMTNWSIRTGRPLEEIINKVKIDDLYADFFVKDPSKQSMHEKTAQEFISQSPYVNNFRKLPGNGKNSLFIHDGKIISKEEHSQLGATSKSLDFCWETGNTTFYATHKYTNDTGGSQDHQFNEVINFVRNASLFKDNNIYFLAVCDGRYYDVLNYKGATRLSYLKSLSAGNCQALQCNDIDAFLKAFI